MSSSLLLAAPTALWPDLTHLRNPALLKTPLTTREAVLSSKIEGTVVTVGEVFRFEAGDEPQQESKRLDIEEIVNYRAALREAERELHNRPFSLNLVLNLAQDPANKRSRVQQGTRHL